MIIKSLVFILLNQVPADGTSFQELDGLLAIEIESAPPVGKWSRESALPGFSGNCYYTWKGPDLSAPSDRSALVYRFLVTTPGRYHLRIHNRHDHPDHTLQNDCYTRMDDGPWVKTFSSERGRWTWRTSHEHSHSDKRPAEYVLAPGPHTLTITGRSVNFSIDRIHLYRDSLKGEDLSRPLSPTTFEFLAGPGPYVKLASLADRIRSGRGYGEILKTLRARRGSADPEEAREAGAMLEALERAGRRAIDTALSLKDPLEALRLLDQAASQYAGDPLGTKASEESRALRQNPQVQAEIRAEAAWKKVEESRSQLKPVNGVHDPRSDAWRRRNQAALQMMLAACRDLVKNHPGTAAAGRAEAILREYP